jgi:hypothetical protein
VGGGWGVGGGRGRRVWVGGRVFARVALRGAPLLRLLRIPKARPSAPHPTHLDPLVSDGHLQAVVWRAGVGWGGEGFDQ